MASLRLFFKVDNFCVSLRTLDACVWDDCWNLQDREGMRCLSNYIWLEDITIGRANVPLHFLHCFVELVQGSQSKIEDLAL